MENPNLKWNQGEQLEGAAWVTRDLYVQPAYDVQSQWKLWNLWNYIMDSTIKLKNVRYGTKCNVQDNV